MSKGLRAPIYINGNAFGWSSIAVEMSILDKPVFGISSIDFQMDQEGEPVYGLSTFPIGLGFGKINTQGSIVFYQDEYDNIIKTAKAAGYDYIMDVPPFTITIVFKAPSNSSKITTVRINNCNFMKFGFTSSLDTMANEIEVPILYSDIEYIF